MTSKAMAPFSLLLAVALAAGCSDENETLLPSGDGGADGGDGGADTDADGDSDADSDADGDSDTDADGDSDTDTDATTGELTGTIRDFSSSHPDFEDGMGHETGIVEDDLGGDGKPVYAGGDGTATTHGQEAFDQWFDDVAGVNESTVYSILLEDDGEGLYVYDNQEFFPIDGQLLGDEGNPHNYHFTYEIHTEFTYLGGEEFRFIGDDDLWVFINGRLAIDLGGVHGAMDQVADLDEQSADLGIEVGGSYPLDFFFAERHTVASTFRIETTIADLTPVID